MVGTFDVKGIELLLTTDAFYRLQSVRSLSISAGFQLTSPSYFKNGAQINTPMDVEIAQSIEENLVPWPGAWKDQQPGKYLHTDAYQKILPEYTKTVWQYAVSTPRLLVHMLLMHPTQKSTVPEWAPPSPFVYTPLHGVGGLVFPDLCQSVGISNISPVKEQIHPNPDFPTVSFPNPEEAGALDLAMQTANKEGKTLIVAHDPDADRFAAAEKVK